MSEQDAPDMGGAAVTREALRILRQKLGANRQHDEQRSVNVNFTTAELRRSITDFEKRVIYPAMREHAAQIIRNSKLEKKESKCRSKRRPTL